MLSPSPRRSLHPRRPHLRRRALQPPGRPTVLPPLPPLPAPLSIQGESTGYPAGPAASAATVETASAQAKAAGESPASLSSYLHSLESQQSEPPTVVSLKESLQS